MIKFSSITNKIKNRKYEISTILRHLAEKPVYTVLSFPDEYAFERELYRKSRTPLLVYNMQTNHNIRYSRQFISDTGNMVFMPLKKYFRTHKQKVKKTIRLSDFLTLSDFYFGNVKLKKGDVFNVREVAPNKFDIIDLDYVDSFNVDNFSELVSLYSEKLMSGGVICVTFNLQYYRTINRVRTKRAKEWGVDPISDETLGLFDYDRLQSSTTSPKKYFKNPKSISKFGVPKSKIDKYLIIASNIIDIISKKINKRPIYANIYKGGLNPVYGPNMLRLVFKK